MAGANFGFAGIVTEKLSEESYENWKECLKSYFISQGLWSVVSGEEAEPTDRSSPEYETWIRKNAMALHAIQISCEKDTMSKLRGNVSAKLEWDLLAEKVRQPLPDGICKVEGEVAEKSIISEYRNVYKAVEKGDWEVARSFLEENPDAVRARITLNGDTILHVAVLSGQTRIVNELMTSESEVTLELINEMGYTAFSIAAINGCQEMVEAMLERDPNLVTIKDSHGLIPIVAASFFSSRDMVRYLYTKTPHKLLSPENPDRSGATLLNCLITDEIYDMALDLLEKFPLLAFVEDHHRNYTIRLLAHKRSAFASGNNYGFWKQWIYSCINVTLNPDDHESKSSDEENIIRSKPKPHIGQVHLGLIRGIFSNFLKWFVPDLCQIYEQKLKHARVHEILKCIFKHLPYLKNEHIGKIGWDQAIQDAIKNGIIEFVDELMESTPEIVWRKDKMGRTIFAHAILQRQEKIFSHVYGLGAKMRIAIIRHDIFRNNFLHLAAKLSPQSRLNLISGAALQMQRELEWFEEVRSILPPKYMEDVNENNKTPSELFTEEHEELVKEGERWMKSTAASCMVVATLIAAVMFTSAFTVPGGNDNQTGMPIFSHHDAFFIFVVSNSLSLFSSSTSALVFLGILTSRYAEQDFRISLPTKLIVGLSTLFFSIVTMMSCFGATVSLILEERLRWFAIPVIIVSIIPIALYAFFLCPLLVEVFIRTYGRSIFKKPMCMQKVH